MKSRWYLLVLMGMGFLFPAAAEQLTTVGIIDLAKVSTAFYSNSQAVRELNEMKARLQTEINNITAEINQLKERKLQADNAGNQSLSLRLDEEIYNKTNYLRDYFRIRNGQLQEREKRLSESSSFVAELQRAIAFVAEDQGYNVILKSSDPNLLWWSRQVDITELVIARLMQNR